MTATVLLIYSLISGAILSLLWLVFRLAGINRLTCHRLNRLLLVSILVASAALPAIAFIERPAPEALPAAVIEMPEIEVDLLPVLIDDGDVVAAAPVPTLGDRIVSLLPTVYMLGLAASLLWLLVALGGVAAAIIRGEKRRIDSRTTLVVHSRNITPFTWGRWIVISRADLESNADMLLNHEKAHRLARHWLDLLLARLLTCLDWYWPTAWLLSRDLAAVHEYQADRRVISVGAEGAAYQMLLIRKGAAGFFSNIANPFNYSSLKNRITMMQKKQSSARSRMRYLVMLPAAAFAIYFSSSPALASAVSSRMPAKPAELAVTEAPAAIDAPAATDAPAPSVIVIPADSAQVKYYPSVEVEEPETGTLADMLVGVNTTERKLLYIVDGKISTQEAALKLPKEKLILVGVNKTQDVVDKYGDAAKDGVIEITTTDAPAEMQAAAKANLDNAEVLTADNAVQVRTRKVDAAATEKRDACFPGGDEKMYQFLARYIRYPEDAVLNNIEGTVIVQFKVNSDGSISDGKVVRGIYPSLDEEALRVISKLPKFEPATDNGRPVASWYTLPISFRFSGTNPNMLYVLDGRKLTADEAANLNKTVGREEIGCMTVLTAERAKEIYGDEGAHGAILMQTRAFMAKQAELTKKAPTFPGGDKEMYQFLARNIRYPAEAAKKDIQGRVIVQFLVHKDGSLDSAKVVRSVDPLLDAEAVRVVKSMPKFIPGTQNGEPVDLWYTMPINFKLSGESSKAPKGGADELVVSGGQGQPVQGNAVGAKFPGGEPALMKYLADNVKYPAEAIKAKAQGKVQVGVNIDEKGHIANVKVLDNQSGNAALAEEAIRVVKGMPDFTPATLDGKPQKSYRTIPVTFKLK